jgi:hypothetical protein
MPGRPGCQWVSDPSYLNVRRKRMPAPDSATRSDDRNLDTTNLLEVELAAFWSIIRARCAMFDCARKQRRKAANMGIKDQLTTEQFKAIYNGPFAAATYVSTASGGGFEMVSELLSAGRFLGEQVKAGDETGYGELVDGLLEDLRGMSKDEAKNASLKAEGKDPVAVRAQTKEAVAAAGATVAGMAGADGYKKWLLDIARTVAATKTGGFLGIGAKSVIDEQEQAALDELAATLEISA